MKALKIPAKQAFLVGIGLLAIYCLNWYLRFESLQSYEKSDAKGKGSDCYPLCDVPICSQNMPAIPENTTFGFHGWKRNMSKSILPSGDAFAERSNQMREFFHALDMAFHESAELVVKNDEGFPVGKPLSDFYPGIDEQFLESLGVSVFNSSRKYADQTVVEPNRLYYHKQSLTPEEIMNHRHWILQRLYHHLSNQTLLSSDVNDKYCTARKRFGSQGKHVVVHNRGIHYPCVKNIAEVDITREMPPDLIIDIMEQSNMTNSRILLIHDGGEKSKNTTWKLAWNSITGPLLTVIPHDYGNPFSDMMLAILSDLFIGNSSSSFSWLIAEVREALGLGPSRLFHKKVNRKWIDSCAGKDYNCLYRDYCFTYAR